MQIVTDSGADLCLPQDQLDALNIHTVPLVVTLEGTAYREGVDIEVDEFYRMLAATEGLPTTSQPSTGDFVDTYRRLAADDPEILLLARSCLVTLSQEPLDLFAGFVDLIGALDLHGNGLDTSQTKQPFHRRNKDLHWNS